MTTRNSRKIFCLIGCQFFTSSTYVTAHCHLTTIRPQYHYTQTKSAVRILLKTIHLKIIRISYTRRRCAVKKRNCLQAAATRVCRALHSNEGGFLSRDSVGASPDDRYRARVYSPLRWLRTLRSLFVSVCIYLIPNPYKWLILCCVTCLPERWT